MRLDKVLFAVALAVTFGFGTSAQAGSWLSLGALVVSTDTGDIQTATSFTFASPAAGTMLTGSATGIFASIAPGTVIGTTALDLTGATPLITLSYSGYTFVADTLVEDTKESGEHSSRVVDLSGYINGPSFTNLATTFTLSFNQDGGANMAIGYGGSLNTTVPEPASVAMLAMGGLGLGAVALRRRARSRA